VPGTIELKGERSVVRPWRHTDAASLVKHANNVNVARQLRDRFPHPYTPGNAREFIRLVAEARPITSFAIVVDEEAAGGIGFSPGTDVERYSAEIGYWLGEPFWGRGIVAEALRLVSEYAFRTCNMLRLFAVPFADNARSIRVLEKAGYACEGILRASSVKYGVPRDQALYALINAEWRKT
jgi:[ribosomal protein S5]-alanine N-acetyltransferase